jgi:hypothetical protein
VNAEKGERGGAGPGKYKRSGQERAEPLLAGKGGQRRAEGLHRVESCAYLARRPTVALGLAMDQVARKVPNRRGDIIHLSGISP